jgi:hypothetical protein
MSVSLTRKISGNYSVTLTFLSGVENELIANLDFTHEEKKSFSCRIRVEPSDTDIFENSKGCIVNGTFLKEEWHKKYTRTVLGHILYQAISVNETPNGVSKLVLTGQPTMYRFESARRPVEKRRRRVA